MYGPLSVWLFLSISDASLCTNGFVYARRRCLRYCRYWTFTSVTRDNPAPPPNPRQTKTVRWAKGGLSDSFVRGGRREKRGDDFFLRSELAVISDVSSLSLSDFSVISDCVVVLFVSLCGCVSLSASSASSAGKARGTQPGTGESTNAYSHTCAYAYYRGLIPSRYESPETHTLPINDADLIRALLCGPCVLGPFETYLPYMCLLGG